MFVVEVRGVRIHCATVAAVKDGFDTFVALADQHKSNGHASNGHASNGHATNGHVVKRKYNKTAKKAEPVANKRIEVSDSSKAISRRLKKRWKAIHAIMEAEGVDSKAAQKLLRERNEARAEA